MIFLLAIILLLLCNVNGLKQINRPNSNVWIAKELESLDEMSTSKIGELMTDLDNKGLFYIKKLAQTNHALRLQDRFQRFSDNNERFHCFMGVRDEITNDIIGYAEVGLSCVDLINHENKDDYDSIDNNNNDNALKYPLIGNVVVAECFRRQGIAECLLLEIEKKALEHSFSELKVAVEADNEAAHKLYLKMGYSNPQSVTGDKILLTKKIASSTSTFTSTSTYENDESSSSSSCGSLTNSQD